MVYKFKYDTLTVDFTVIDLLNHFINTEPYPTTSRKNYPRKHSVRNLISFPDEMQYDVF